MKQLLLIHILQRVKESLRSLFGAPQTRCRSEFSKAHKLACESQSVEEPGGGLNGVLYTRYFNQVPAYGVDVHYVFHLRYSRIFTTG